MSETTRHQMRDQLAATLTLIAAELARVDIRIGDPHAADLDTDLHHWQAALWNSADDLAGPDTGYAWSSTIGLEDAARRWVHAADAYTAYRQMAAPWRGKAFEGHMGACESALRLLVEGRRWTVRALA